MAGKQISAGDSFTSNLAGMSKNQLYEIMSQMKTLIEQNQQQARQILVDNPALTKALFQAQIMLGMVKPPQVMPNIQQAPSQPPKQSAQPSQQLNAPAAQSLQDQASASQTHIPARKQQSNQPPVPIPSASVQTMPTHPLQSLQQSKGYPSPSGQMTSISLPQSSQMHNMTPGPLHSVPQPPSLQPQQLPIVSSQPQQSLHSSGIAHLPLQPPLPSQPRPPLMQPFQHQVHSQMGSHMGFQLPGVSQPHLSQPSFNSGNKPPGSIGSSFPQGQPPLPSQPPPHSLYQVGGGLHLGTDFSGQAGSSMQVDRPAWMPPGLQENPTAGLQLPGPPMAAGQMGIGSQHPRPPQLTPEMEKALLQQVMSLTPEQINLLPPEQRHQVLQLQQMLR
ncbi:Cleavage stimulation factor subunit 2 [Macleaya cordata]|uniref:Cleavage stimulation factor subunit 2 n=1 Tax=Macleaya cordata TaxID=56857 RepID=A0A200Q3F1_MACCD|nr:Cleavage stimulation factor subunit 2 [Macleaya cordata]